jgi:hypothetical protein
MTYFGLSPFILLSDSLDWVNLEFTLTKLGVYPN